MSEQTIKIWQERIGRAAELLGHRIDQPPTLEELAAEARVSPFHLHRIWRVMTGETVGQTITRLRMEAAMADLAEDKDVTGTAMAAGYATPQSFARAFRRETGQSPTGWRSRGENQDAAAQPPSAPIQIVRRDDTTVVALRSVGHEYVGLNATFQAVWDWAESVGALEGLQGLYGIPLDDPETVPVEDLRFDAALALGPVTAPEPFHVAELRAGDHARLLHQGSYDALENATQSLVEWVIASGREPADAPLYYHYLNDPEQTPEEALQTEILLPLKEHTP